MNFLFGLAIAAGTAAVIPLCWYLFGLTKTGYTKQMWIGYVVIVALIGFTNFQTYGPRNGIVKHQQQEYIPKRKEKLPSTPLVEPVDRIGQFDQLLEDEDPRKEE